MGKFAPIRSGDEKLDRVQDAVAKALGASDPRNQRLAALGIWVGSSAPTTPITYAAWASGAAGYWGWIAVP